MLITKTLLRLKISLGWFPFLYHIASIFFILQSQMPLLLLQIILQILCTWSHIQTIKTVPGPIKMKESPFRNENLKKLPLIQQNQYQLDTRCDVCENWKPPKTSHCRICNKCIHYRDHHCYWLDCCIGYKNLKFFCQYLLYIFLLTITHGVTLSIKIIVIIQKIFLILDQSSWIWIYQLFKINTVSIFIHFIIVLGGVFIPLDQILNKRMLIPDLNTYKFEQNEIKKFVYFRSVNQNLFSLLGSNILLWFLPLANKINLNYLELLYPKVTEGKELLDYHLNPRDENYALYKLYEVE